MDVASKYMIGARTASLEVVSVDAKPMRRVVHIGKCQVVSGSHFKWTGINDAHTLAEARLNPLITMFVRSISAVFVTNGIRSDLIADANTEACAPHSCKWNKSSSCFATCMACC